MKMNLRNRLLALAAISVSSVMLLSGFDSALTAQDVLSKAQEASKTMSELTADVQANADVSIDVTASGQTSSLPITGNANMTIKYLLDPIEYALTGSASGDASALGYAGEASMEMYMVDGEDGSGKIYVKLAGVEGVDGWQAAVIPAESMNQLNSTMASAMSGDISSVSEATGLDIAALQEQLLGGAVLAPEAVNVNGKDCYEITYAITGDQIVNVLSEMAAAKPELGLDETTIQMASMLCSTLKLDCVVDYEVETFRAVYASFDLGQSDFTMISQLLGPMLFPSTSSETEAAPDVKLTVNALNLSYNYDWDTPVSIDVPEEALSAPVEEVDPEALMQSSDIAA